MTCNPQHKGAPIRSQQIDNQGQATGSAVNPYDEDSMIVFTCKHCDVHFHSEVDYGKHIARHLRGEL